MYVERVDSPQAVRVRGSSGGRGPLYCTAMGKSLLAFQPEREAIIQRLDLHPMTPSTITDRETLRREIELTRARKYSLANEEHEPGVLSIGMPVLDACGCAIAALCVTAPAFRSSLDDLKQYIPLLRDGAYEIAIQLPYSGVST